MRGLEVTPLEGPKAAASGRSPSSMQERVDAVNHAALGRALAWLGANFRFDEPEVLLVSPHRANVRFVRQAWPQARLAIATIDDWNLDMPAPPGIGRFDLVVASNVLHYSRDPKGWIDHLGQVSRFVVLQDLIDRRRGDVPPHLGADGDAVRFAYARMNEASPFGAAFDFGHLDPLPLFFEAFDAPGASMAASRASARHFCAVLQGEVVQVDLTDSADRARLQSRVAVYRSLPRFAIARLARRLKAALGRAK